MTEPSLWQRVVDKVRSQADRLTHTWSRKRAQLRLRRRGRPRRIVVLCYGNICRSPYAEAYLRHRLGRDGVTNVYVGSAGIIGPDRPANEQGAATALSRGFNLSAHRSRLFTDEDAGMTDLILVMTRSHRDHLIRRFGVSRERIELLGDFDVEDPPYREISDPYGHPEEEFKRVFGQIERSVEGLCAAWREPSNGTGDALQ